MKVDAGLRSELRAVPESVRELEALGYDGVLTTETSHDPFLPLLLAAEHSERVQLTTSIAVAFARNPMTVASLAHDLNAYSGGRFVLGLGSQIKPHITKRFSMPWSQPAARMREFIEALRAIWASWYEGERLSFRGDFYTHTLMTPNFTPEDVEHGPPPVILAAVGPLMTRTAGEVADGMIAHRFTTERYLREVTVPALEQALESSGRRREDFTLSYPAFIVSGSDEEELAANRAAVAKHIAFYGSTPAYRPVLELHGWGELQDELNAMSKRGLWDEMAALIDDEILDTFAIVGEPDEIVPRLRSRYGDLVDRITADFDFVPRAGRQELIEQLRA